MTLPIDRRPAVAYFAAQARGLYKFKPDLSELVPAEFFKKAIVPAHVGNEEGRAALAQNIRQAFPHMLSRLKSGHVKEEGEVEVRTLCWYGYGCKRKLLQEFFELLKTTDSQSETYYLDILHEWHGKRHEKHAMRNWLDSLSSSKTDDKKSRSFNLVLNHWQALDYISQRDILCHPSVKWLLIATIWQIDGPLASYLDVGEVEYLDCTTFEPYPPEDFNTIFDDFMGSKSAELDEDQMDGVDEQQILRAAKMVLATLTQNARDIFKLIADFQRDKKAMSEAELLVQTKNRLLVSDAQALKAVLTEFQDHQLIKMTEQGHLITSFDSDDLAQFFA